MRGIMAKKAKAQKKTDGPAVPASIMAAYRAVAEKKIGVGSYSGSDHKDHQIGVLLPSLALEYLLGSNVLYLGALFGLAGPSQSFKSALAMEFGKIIASMGGVNFLSETEGGKISAPMMADIYGDLIDRLDIRLAQSVEQAQQYLSFTAGYLKNQFPARNQLAGLFLDSLNGPAANERTEKIEKDGYASRDFPVEALLWSKWFQSFAPKLTGWPITLIFVNHKKLDINNPKSFRHPGGDAQDFYSTVYMHIARVRTNEGTDTIVNHVKVATVKHSFMPPGRRINLPFVLDKVTKHMGFDWGHATAALLVDEKLVPSVKDIIKVVSSSKSMTALTRTFSCKRLGLSNVSGAELGAAVHADVELMRELREALYIHINDVWNGTMPVDEHPLMQYNSCETETGSNDDPLDMS